MDMIIEKGFLRKRKIQIKDVVWITFKAWGVDIYRIVSSKPRFEGFDIITGSLKKGIQNPFATNLRLYFFFWCKWKKWYLAIPL